MKKVAAIIQARMGSTRLPGKVLMDIAGKPMLEHIVERLKLVKNIDEIVVATSTSEDDIDILDFAETLGVIGFAGDESNVLKRYIDAAETVNADIVVRVTGDAPLINPDTIERLISSALDQNADYAICNPEIPVIHEGFEVVSLNALKKVLEIANQDYLKEHVTIYLTENPDFVKTVYIEAEDEFKRTGYRFSVDTLADLRFIREIYKRLYKEGEIVALHDVIELLDKEPEIKQINAHITQKKVDVKSNKVAFRVDASEKLGMGHLVRCLYLAKSLNEKHHCGILFVIKDDQLCEDKIKSLGYDVRIIDSELPYEHEFSEVRDILVTFNSDIIIIDLKHKVSTGYVKSLKELENKVVILDNFSEGCFAADLVIFPIAHMLSNVLNDKRWRESNSRCLTGAEYFPLPESFLNYNGGKLTDNKFTILVTMGGSDPNKITLKVINALKKLKKNFEAKVVIGPYVKYADELPELDSRFEILSNINDMASLMSNVDVAITAFGITLYELAYMGVPQIIIYNYLSDEGDVNRFNHFGTSISLGYHEDVSIDDIATSIYRFMDDEVSRKQMSINGIALVDGKGIERISQIIMAEL